MRFTKKLLLLLCVAQALLPVAFAQTQLDINERTRGNLPTSRLNAPGIAGLCLLTDGNGHVSIAACPAGSGGGSGTFPQSLANASRKWLNSYDATTGLFTQAQPVSTALADFSAIAPTTAGKIPIYDPTATNSAGGTGAYVPGDPLVQGLFADASTSLENPVAIGGYDTAGTPALHRSTFINGTPGGTEYGIVTRNIPSGTQPVSGTVAATQSGTWTVQPGNTANTTAWKVDGSAVTQPVSIGSSVTVAQATGTNLHTVVDSAPTTAITAASLPLPSGAATAAKQPALGTAGTPSTDVITVQGAASGTAIKVDGSAVTQPVSGTVNAAQSGTWTVQPGNTANTTAWKVDGSAVTQPVSVAATLNVQGAKTNNNAAPGATNMGTLPALANAAVPSITEGNQSALSVDLGGNLRVYGHPPNVLGCYMVNGRTSVYSGLAAATPLFAYRWGDATHIAIINHVKVQVIATVAATTAGQAEREMVIARGMSTSYSGGTAVTLTGNNQKMRTSQGTSLVTDMRFGTTLTAGTQTLDANPIASAVAWLPLNMTGVDIGCGGAGPTGAVWSCVGSTSGYIDLLNTANGQDYPLVLATNEGFIIRVGKDAMPAGASQQTYVTVSWCEASAY